MHGVKRVIAFCLLIVMLPATLIIIPLYLRHSVFADVTYLVAESDIIEIRDGVSSVFCQQHSLRMDTNFNAFQLQSKPEISTNHKHIRLKKSMTLPDDTLEYWGFYLLKGAIVELKVCSRYDGSRILVVKGDRNLETCGLLEHNKNKVGAHFAKGHEKVQVTFETVAEVVLSKEIHTNPDTKNNIHSKEIIQHKIPKSFDDNPDDYDNNGEEEIDDEFDNIHNLHDKNIKKHTQLEHRKNDRMIDKTDKMNAHLFSFKISDETGNHTNIINDNKIDKKMDTLKHRRRRHHHPYKRSKLHKRHKNNIKWNKIYNELYGSKKRIRRDQIYDRKISHGGNAFNFSDNESDSISSFENSLLTCYDGQILLAQGFPPSSLCTSVRYLEGGTHMVSRHEVINDGYYYYIFYSDNDLVRNDIHAVFDIYKPTFQYSNITDSKICVNSSNCTFPINFMSDEIIVVEVPTRDGIEHDEDDITYLISTCHPRMAVYVIFPISVLLLILGCAFL